MAIILSLSGGAAAGAMDPCDRLVSLDIDPQRAADPIPFAFILGPVAVDACREAVRREPGSARFRFQFGIALDRVGRHADSTRHIKSAATMGHAAAETVYANIMMTGTPEPEQPDATYDVASWPAESKNTSGMLNFERRYAMRRTEDAAIRWLRDAADAGDRWARYLLGVALVFSPGSSKRSHLAEGRTILRDLMAADMKPARDRLIDSLLASRRPGDLREARNLLERAARRGDQNSAARLARIMKRRGATIPR